MTMSVSSLPTTAANRILLTLQKLRNQLRAVPMSAAASWDARNEARTRAIDRIVTCRLCGVTDSHEVIGKVPITFAGPVSDPGYCLLRCTACDVIYLDPLPAPADLKALYEGARQFDDLAGSCHASALRILNSYQRRIRYLGLLPRSGDSVLEIGAGPAWVSRACKEHDPGVRTVAQDISAECAASCPWVDEYVVGPLSLLSRRKFRLVSLTHVIEHVPDPAKTLLELRDYVEPGGHVYITAPFRPSGWRAGAGIRRWLRYSYLHVPAHISYLSRKWLAQCAGRCGFELAHWDDSLDACQVFEAVLRR